MVIFINKIITYSPEETLDAGYKYASSVNISDVIGFTGELGSGKTQFIKGICKYFHVKDVVNSPTFLIVNEYKATMNIQEININHFDLYRLKSEGELLSIGFDNYISENSICLIEWPDLAIQHLGIEIKSVNFDYGNNENERIIYT
ncbi:MAG: tRNA (adenosine(37)-N6)-threonylcarbamoyltransferase complex ATPase subunit type 1 TsaE [Ignavibacteria bacterium]|nr:tRNA (adenosine(37)-N6)-threonylcarbamoyltransferase complex ATPase subunit type 1 TsaE [Ignavibacteria bacterium]